MNEINEPEQVLTSNPYMEINPGRFNELKELTERSDKYVAQLIAKGKKRDIKRGIFPKYKKLYEWILSILPECISDKKYSLPTKIFWILNGITSWDNSIVKCKNCGKPFIGKNVVNLYTGYHEYCSLSCAGRSKDINDKKKQNSILKYGVAHPAMLAETSIKRKHTMLKLHGDENWNNCEKAKATRLLKFNGKYAPADHREKCRKTHIKNGHPENWNNRDAAIRTRLIRNNGIYESSESKTKREMTCMAKYGYKTNLQCEDTKQKSAETCMRKYGVKCYNQTDEFRQRSAKAMFTKYGCCYPAQSPEIQHKSKRRYSYSMINFDTAPELAYFIWLKDNNIDFEYHPQKFFEYEFEGRIHRYFPDFFVENKYIEIKGDQFFKPDGTMFCPYRNKTISDEIYEQRCRMYEAKQQCMTKNGVVILKSADYKIYIDYVRNKYGHDYLKKFRK